MAEAKLQKQLAKEERTARIVSAASALSGKFSASWNQVQQQAAARQAVIVEPVTGMELIHVTGGCFQMGDTFGTGRPNELPVHQVCLDDYYLGKYEVTQSQWKKIMGFIPPQTQTGDNHPVGAVNWQDAMAFANILSGSQGNYRLPTEAEWEYAARSGGKEELFSGGLSADAVAWHEGNSSGSPHPIGQKQPNGLGFHDMSGNLWEWCLDRYAADYYSQSPTQNPTGPSSGTDRSIRGGSWNSKTRKSSTSYRSAAPEARTPNRRHGFRLTLPLPR
jgi:formylglycine-generating enzyme required for sulfatase activity